MIIMVIYPLIMKDVSEKPIGSLMASGRAKRTRSSGKNKSPTFL
jgi:hypothetical protein